MYPLYRKNFDFAGVFFLGNVCVYILCNAVNLIAYGHVLLRVGVCMYGECLPHF